MPSENGCQEKGRLNIVVREYPDNLHKSEGRLKKFSDGLCAWLRFCQADWLVGL
ncbi:hypothetical protein [Neisseria sp.]|uniref:hypothetical protein n=1 Tax=Neisseria sp. TaxID=192066 RepID=UPI0035A0340B